VPASTGDDSANIQDIGSARPYRRAARIYYKKGWSPLPLPPRAKETPPREFSGRGKPYPDEDQIDEWIADRPAGNICLRMPTLCDETHDVVGIDVDEYTSGGKQKHGAAQLAALEKRLGPLPATYRSTSRGIDNPSGIRFFRVPTGLRWLGKAAKDIDLCSPGYRYSVVYPSWHPEDRQYRFIDELTNPAEPRIIVSVKDVPEPTDLPELPATWVDFLTSGGMLEEDVEIDMDTAVPDIVKWARRALPKPNPELGKSGMCKRMKSALADAKKKIDDEPSSHDKIRDAHWSLLRLASEGHTGWSAAIRSVEAHWTKDVKSRDKRTLGQLKGEVFRSKINAMRKLKGEVDRLSSDGIEFLAGSCTCYSEIPEDDGPEGSGSGGKGVVDGITMQREIPSPDEYKMSDDGNAEHLLDIIGPDNAHYVPGYGTWILWSENESRWITDAHGTTIRRIFWRVRNRQYRYAEGLASSAVTAASRGDEELAKQLRGQAKEWRSWANRSGGNRGSSEAIEAARAFPGITIDVEALDANPALLGVANGVIDLLPSGEDPWRLRPMDRADLVTHTTGLPLLPILEAEQWLKDHPSSGAGVDAELGASLFKDYLDTFLPDHEIQAFTQKVLGYSLFGDNRERICVFLHGETTTGKSMLLEVVMSALGDYADVVNLQIFKERSSGLNPELAQAFPKRLITASEVSHAQRMHADVFKRITGADRMTAELKGVNTIIRRKPAFVPVIATNAAPTIPGADEALRKRLCVIPFKVRIPDSEEDPSLRADLVAHGGPAVLRWLVEGWASYRREGLVRETWPAEVRADTDAFHSDLSEVGQFLAEKTRRRIGAVVSCAALYGEYVSWCAEQNIVAVMPATLFRKSVPAVVRKARPGPPGAKEKPVQCYIDLEIGEPRPRDRKLKIVRRRENTPSGRNTQKRGTR
jgi:P4 family phage/plasmid primase-like protien